MPTRWHVEQLYVTRVLKADALPAGMSVKGKGGATIAVKKRGGWKASWVLAQAVAGWS